MNLETGPELTANTNWGSPSEPSTGSSFSWKRVLRTVFCGLVLIVPSLFYLGSERHFDTEICDLGSLRSPLLSPKFDLQDATIPIESIHQGGPPKDGIPALTEPRFVSPHKVDFLGPDDRVIGVSMNGVVRAYPLKILNYHEIVNDSLDDRSIAVTYCPLCDSASVVDRQSQQGTREFGVSGLLYNNNVLMYDRTAGVESLWSQIAGTGVSGPGAGEPLRNLPVELTTWSAWLSRHPATQILSADTGHKRDYERSPYRDYLNTSRLIFPVESRDPRLPLKEKVLGVKAGELQRVYPESLFMEGQLRIEDRIAGLRVVIEFEPSSKTMRVVEADDGVQWMYSLWFAWYAMHPETDVYSVEER